MTMRAFFLVAFQVLLSLFLFFLFFLVFLVFFFFKRREIFLTEFGPAARIPVIIAVLILFQRFPPRTPWTRFATKLVVVSLFLLIYRPCGVVSEFRVILVSFVFKTHFLPSNEFDFASIFSAGAVFILYIGAARR